ncbi:ABC-three component system middle component 1 [Nevskia ramosa]|uniref:ABC-three component system middle component 1 n=1 Tax=Nevskia ramosa TaxID=64002 RepID=UPI0003B4583F|nr:ABC-three component system middle component 1 [Nevskia ramosa]
MAIETAAAPSGDNELIETRARLIKAAEIAGLNSADVDALVKPEFNGGAHSDAARLSPGDLLRPIAAVRLGCYSVVIGMLPSHANAEAVNETLRRFRNQCVVARSYLRANEALDLQGILIGPRGSERDEEWRALALTVERDDRVARKFVWLRPESKDADEASFHELVKRTFLARPWRSEGTFTMAALDNLKRVALTWNVKVSRNTVDEWMELGVSQSEDSDELVQKLVESWSRREQS